MLGSMTKRQNRPISLSATPRLASRPPMAATAWRLPLLGNSFARFRAFARFRCREPHRSGPN